MLTPKLFAWVVGVVTALLTAVIVVGLVEKQLDVTGVAISLSTLISGIVVGALVRSKPPGGGGAE